MKPLCFQIAVFVGLFPSSMIVNGQESYDYEFVYDLFSKDVDVREACYNRIRGMWKRSFRAGSSYLTNPHALSLKEYYDTHVKGFEYDSVRTGVRNGCCPDVRIYTMVFFNNGEKVRSLCFIWDGYTLDGVNDSQLNDDPRLYFDPYIEPELRSMKYSPIFGQLAKAANIVRR